MFVADEQEDLRAGGVAEAALPERDPDGNLGGNGAADERQEEGRNCQQPQRATAARLVNMRERLRHHAQNLKRDNSSVRI